MKINFAVDRIDKKQKTNAILQPRIDKKKCYSQLAVFYDDSLSINC